MTETQSEQSEKSHQGEPSVVRHGLTIERIYTNPGVHPYDEVTWERRDVVQTNWKTGETVFEQRGVEFPDFWSVNASTIVTTKYFRGAVGTDVREWSLKQLVDRVVLTYAKAGREHGYFATDADAEVFEHELTWMLLHQVFCFNSPVWFNVGTTSPQQVSACFILAVDDTMDSILNWYREEGLIFKGGSGAGLNLSRIRSSKELLSSGGTASGPVCFMRGADASAGTIKSGGATRRAAKMVVLDVDHPDIEEFVETKMKEEDKIRVLRDAGYDMDLGGKDITSVQYQNANNSVRVSDEFMRAVESGTEFGLRGRKTGEVIETVDASGLFEKISARRVGVRRPGHPVRRHHQRLAHQPRDRTDHRVQPLLGVHVPGQLLLQPGQPEPAEVPQGRRHLRRGDVRQGRRAGHHRDGHLDLLRGLPDRGDRGHHPQVPPAGHRLRQPRRAAHGVGPGLRLRRGPGARRGHHLADDRHRVQALRRAGRVVGPYEGFARNAEAHTRVMRKHAAANDAVRTFSSLDRDVHRAAAKAWEACLAIGAQNGWRNAQASVLAPTGTIGFMMDCDTTGIEPDFSLVKFKKLVGGGSMQIVNQTIPRALRKLGYAEETIEAIVEYIAEHGHVIDAPGLRPEHYAVFDCAMGERSIAPMGHVRMMAAVQPFISGAISKTVNLPESATVEEIEDVYFQGWKLGLKALAVYRDNCKVGQPLSDAQGQERDPRSRPARPEPSSSTARPASGCPKSRPSITTSFTVGGAEGYMTAGSYPDNGLGEVFLKLGKQGSTLAGVMDAFSIAVSIGLQYGVPLETFVTKFTNLRFEPAGLTDDPDVRMAQSMMDYIFRRLALDYLPFDERSALGIYTAEERSPRARHRLVRAGRRRRPRRRPRRAGVIGADGRGPGCARAVGPRGGSDAPGRGPGCSGRRALLGGADGEAHRNGCGRSDVLHLRHQDATGGRCYVCEGCGAPAAAVDVVGQPGTATLRRWCCPAGGQVAR